ncbi:MAG: hypothetical protein MK102_01410 [Fuerstiella sp.]|nr:hypothetical protein [Fuerstiella sp.]
MLNLVLVGENESPVCDLTGFRKSHRVPDDTTDRSRTFVRRIAVDDVGRDLDQRFADLRRELGLKRAQMQVSDPADGCGSIKTPEFTYQVSADLSSKDPTAVVWRRSVFGFTAPESVLAENFSATFGTTFDTVEFAPRLPVDVETFIDWIEDQANCPLQADYDRTVSWCCLTAPQQKDSIMLIRPHVVSLQSLSPCAPKTLLTSFLAFHDLLPAIEWFS